MRLRAQIRPELKLSWVWGGLSSSAKTHRAKLPRPFSFNFHHRTHRMYYTSHMTGELIRNAIPETEPAFGFHTRPVDGASAAWRGQHNLLVKQLADSTVALIPRPVAIYAVIESGNKLTEIMAHNLKDQQSAGHHPVIPAVDHTSQFAAKCHASLVTTIGAFDALEKSGEQPSNNTIAFELSAKESREKSDAEVAIRQALEIEMMGIKVENTELLTDIKALREAEVTRTEELEEAREFLQITSRILQERARFYLLSMAIVSIVLPQNE
ncbi:hypothetical protein O988_05099 [Pseudogymnoascus sp. VKM F-3808]|nr:hypothetical protein O988_05099 [Pseudogymnoascus sp. VKM F-3808]